MRTESNPEDSRVDAIAGQIKRWAISGGPGTRLPTTREMRSKFGGSYATIMQALQLLEEQNVVVRKPGSGIFVSTKLHQRNIALVFGSAIINAEHSPFWDSLWARFVETAERRRDTCHESLSIHVQIRGRDASVPADDNLVRLISQNRVDGVLGIGLDIDTAAWIVGHEIPLAGFAGAGTWTVMVDYHEMIRVSVPILAAKGCPRIHLWVPGIPNLPKGSTWNSTFYHEARYDFVEALMAHGIAFDPKLMAGHTDSELVTLTSLEQGEAVARARLKDLRNGDGLILVEDMMALGVLKSLRQLAPELLSGLKIVSHSNKGLLTLFAFDDLIDEVVVDPAEIVAAMFAIMDSAWAGNPPTDPHIWVKPKANGTLQSRVC